MRISLPNVAILSKRKRAVDTGAEVDDYIVVATSAVMSSADICPDITAGHGHLKASLGRWILATLKLLTYISHRPL